MNNEQQRAAFSLPPLPFPARASQADYSSGDMEAYARAAIELDRQGRGEPSGYAYRYSSHDGGTVIRFNDGREVNGCKPIEPVPYWFAPQPAEPVPNGYDTPYNLGWAAGWDAHKRANPPEAQPAEPNPTLPYEQALSCLIDKIIPGLDSGDILADARTASAALKAAEPVVKESLTVAEPVHQFRKKHCVDWYDGHPDYSDGGGPYEVRTLYTAPAAAQPSVSAEPCKTCNDNGIVGNTLNAEPCPDCAPSADGRDELKAIHAAARHAGWCFAKHADGVVRMMPLVAGEAKSADGQAQNPI